MEGNLQTEASLPDKNLFRIGEVSRLTSTKPFVLRFWETEFPMLQPVKSPKGHRLYRREDIETVFVIKRLLYDQGFTIAGARRHLSDPSGEPKGSALATASPNGGANAMESEAHAVSQQQAMLNRRTLLDLRDSLRSLLTALESE
ncbi:MAG: MerR family transcriptional regulator [Acidobacteriia bacterium]|nr:MerR family transcriptional regulator [Terriglobia bacterium]